MKVLLTVLIFILLKIWEVMSLVYIIPKKTIISFITFIKDTFDKYMLMWFVLMITILSVWAGLSYLIAITFAIPFGSKAFVYVVLSIGAVACSVFWSYVFRDDLTTFIKGNWEKATKITGRIIQ